MAGKIWAEISNFINKSSINPKAAKEIDSRLRKKVDNQDELKALTNNLQLLLEDIESREEKLIQDRIKASDKLDNLRKDATKKEIREAQEHYDYINAQLIKEDKEREKNYNKKKELDIKEQKLSEDINKIVENIAYKYNLTEEQINKLKDSIEDESFDLEKESLTFTTSIRKLHDIAGGGFKNIINDVVSYNKQFFLELGAMGAIFEMALHQIQELNKETVDFNRSMGQGRLSSSMAGMDIYGNSMSGSLMSLAMTNAISEKEFLNTFKAFGKGNALGATEDFFNQQENMRKFGIQAAQLGKFYGVEMGTINSITSNLVYNFGVKVKDLNQIFEKGKLSALAAGVSIKEYFNNLKEATDLVGKTYIAGGIAGLEKLALWATKTGQTVNQILASTERFKNFTSQYELQNTAAALGFTNTSGNMQKDWALNISGKKDEAQKDLFFNLAKDLRNGSEIDTKTGMINNRGYINLQNLGISQDEIASIQKMLNMVNKSGFSLEQWNNKMYESVEIQSKMNDFEFNNLTIGEKLLKAWGKLYEGIVEPFATLFSPVINDLVDVIKFVADIIGPVFKILLFPITMLGKGLSLLNPLFNQLGNAADGLSKWVDSVRESFKSLSTPMKTFIKILVAAGGIIELYFISKYAGAKIGNSSIGRGIGGLFGKEMSAEAAYAPGIGGIANSGKFLGIGGTLGGKLSKSWAPSLKNAGIGIGIGLAGNALGGLVEDNVSGQMGKTSGSILKMAGDFGGAGMMFGPEGAAIGAGIGAVVAMSTEVWNNVDKVWSDGSTGLWASILHLFSKDETQDKFNLNPVLQSLGTSSQNYGEIIQSRNLPGVSMNTRPDNLPKAKEIPTNVKPYSVTVIVEDKSATAKKARAIE